MLVFAELVVGGGGGEADSDVVEIEFRSPTGGLSLRAVDDFRHFHLEADLARGHAPSSAGTYDEMESTRS